MNTNGSTMNLKHFRDFYFLEAIQAGMTMASASNGELQFRKAFLKLQNDVNETFETLCNRMALHIYAYLWYAALGESYYATQYCSEYYAEELSNQGNYFFLEYPPTIQENVDLIKNVFGQKWSTSGYGGRAWLSIVEGMEMYGKVSNATFIDHAVDLEHNGGCVFDKTSGDNYPVKLNCYSGGFGSGELKNFLDHKFRGDILNHRTPLGWSQSKDWISRKVYDLVVRYNNVVEKINAVDFLVVSYDFLDEFTVEWGNSTLTECTPESETNWQECAFCDNRIDPEDHYHSPHDDCICRECFLRKYERCDKCGDLFDKDEIVVDGYCENCAKEDGYMQCDECGEWSDNCHPFEDSNDVYCDNCVTDDMYCVECDEYYLDMESHNQEEHTEEIEEKEELFPLWFDAEGVLEITELTDKPDGEVTKSIEKVNFLKWDDKITQVLSVVYRIKGVDNLVILDTETFGTKANNFKYIGENNKHFYSITTPCGACIFIHLTKYDLDKAVEIAKKISPVLDWAGLKSGEDFWNVPQETKDYLQSLIGG